MRRTWVPRSTCLWTLLATLACDSAPTAPGSDPDAGPASDATVTSSSADGGVSDLDGDGLPDEWEEAFGLNPSGGGDQRDDLDGDGLSNAAEFRLGTNPRDRDSDDDGLSDAEEDRNRDGVVDPGETDPTVADTDGDGLSDGLELGRTEGLAATATVAGTDAGFVGDADGASRTDPLSTDTDGDGIADGVEDQNQNGRVDGAESDPLDQDSDDDGVPDGVEDANQNGVTDLGETSAYLWDSDGDGLSDGVELGVVTPISDPDGDGPLTGTDLAIFVADADPSSTTDPTDADSDGDGVQDGDEDWNRDGRHDPDSELDPNNGDSDGDMTPDGEEPEGVVCVEDNLPATSFRALARPDLRWGVGAAFSRLGELTDGTDRVRGGHSALSDGRVAAAVWTHELSGSGIANAQDEIRAAIAQVGALSSEQSRTSETWDGLDARVMSANLVAASQSPGTLVRRLAEAALGESLRTPVSESGPSETDFRIQWGIAMRSSSRAIVAIAAAPSSASDDDTVFLGDVANLTGLAQYHDSTGLGCDALSTPPGNDVIDLLWVVDNSCSMNQEQAAVAAVGQAMVDLLSTTQLSWRLALTTTDRSGGEINLSGVDGFTASSPRQQAETESQAWATAVGNLGVRGSGQEKGLVVGLAAVNGALPASASERSDKFREGASVIVVHMSDEEDFSIKQAAGGSDEVCDDNAGKTAEIESLVSQYQALDGESSIAGLTTFAITGTQRGAGNACSFDDGTADCPGASQYGEAYLEVASGTGGGSGSICGDMGQIVQDIIRAGAGIASQLELSLPPISSTLRVVVSDENGGFIGQPEVPRSRSNGFDYAFEFDASSGQVIHKIVFFGTARPPADRSLAISYRTWVDQSPDPSHPSCECPDGQQCDWDTLTCVVDPTCGGGCEAGQTCDATTGLCEDQPCGGGCGEGMSCVDDECVLDDPCSVCEAHEFCDQSSGTVVCRDLN